MRAELAVNERFQFFRGQRFEGYLATVHENRRRALHAERVRSLAIEKDATFYDLTRGALKLLHIKPIFVAPSKMGRTSASCQVFWFSQSMSCILKLTLKTSGFRAGAPARVHVGRHERNSRKINRSFTGQTPFSSWVRIG